MQSVVVRFDFMHRAYDRQMVGSVSIPYPEAAHETVAELNRTFGEGSHWLEDDNGNRIEPPAAWLATVEVSSDGTTSLGPLMPSAST